MLVSNKKKIPTSFIGAGALLWFVVIATIGIYIYNGSVERGNIELKAGVEAIEADINALKQDPEIQIATLITKNKALLEKMEYFSQIPLFISQVDALESEYSLDFDGFKYSKWVVSTDAISEWGAWTESYKKIVRFISDYRDKETQSEKDFALGFVKSVEDDGDINFKVELEVQQKKSQKPKVQNIQESTAQNNKEKSTTVSDVLPLEKAETSTQVSEEEAAKKRAREVLLEKIKKRNEAKQQAQ